MDWLYSFITVASHLLVPLWFHIWIFREKNSSWLRWISVVTLGTSYIGLLYIGGAAWDWVGIFWPNVYLLFFPVIVVISAVRRENLLFLPAKKWQSWLPVITFFAISASLVSGYPKILSARTVDLSQAIVLEFPLKGGSFYIRQGGSVIEMNHHYDIPAQKFALDIVKLNAMGMRASGVFPADNSRYAIFSEPVYAPCSGDVLAARSDLADLTSMQMDAQNPLGNFMALYCGNYTVLLAHLKQGSTKFVAGQRVEVGTVIAEVGNTGNTTEPHLHLQALVGRQVMDEPLIATGTGVQMLFDGRYLIRGDKVSNK